MKITQVQTRITSPVSFGAGNMNNITPNVGLLSLQNSDKLSFEKDLRRTQNADAVQSNPLKAMGYKFAKAYDILFSPKSADMVETADNHMPIYYMA